MKTKPIEFIKRYYTTPVVNGEKVSLYYSAEKPSSSSYSPYVPDKCTADIEIWKKELKDEYLIIVTLTQEDYTNNIEGIKLTIFELFKKLSINIKIFFKYE